MTGRDPYRDHRITFCLRIQSQTCDVPPATTTHYIHISGNRAASCVDPDNNAGRTHSDTSAAHTDADTISGHFVYSTWRLFHLQRIAYICIYSNYIQY